MLLHHDGYDQKGNALQLLEQTFEATLQEVVGVTVSLAGEQASIDSDADATALVEADEDARYIPHTGAYHQTEDGAERSRANGQLFSSEWPTLTLPYISGLEHSGSRHTRLNRKNDL